MAAGFRFLGLVCGRELGCHLGWGSYADGMVGAALSRRAGLGYAATALVFVLMAWTGCGSPARQTPKQGQPRGRAVAAFEVVIGCRDRS